MLSTSKPLELLHMDLFGPTTYKSIGGNLYCLVIVDDFSRYTWVMFLGDKSETPEVFKTFTRRAQREYNSPIVKIRSDNGTEFKNMKIEEWCDEFAKFMLMILSLARSSNEWFSTYISRIFGFHSRLKSEKAKSEKVFNTGLTDAANFLYVG